MPTRPLSLTILACVYIAAGVIGAVNAPEPRWIMLIHSAAVASGVGLLFRQNWARWLAVLWMASHVGISIRHSWWQVAIHAVFLGIIAFVLFRPPANRYFRT